MRNARKVHLRNFNFGPLLGRRTADFERSWGPAGARGARLRGGPGVVLRVIPAASPLRTERERKAGPHASHRTELQDQHPIHNPPRWNETTDENGPRASV
jgi:hypothetical protein